MQKNKEIKLNLGSGATNFGPDWIHIDKGNFPHVKSYDLLNLPFEDNSVSLIYASHLIAYFDRDEILPIIKHWYSKLKENGILRISTTDWDRIVYICKKRKARLNDIIGPIMGRIKIGDKLANHKEIYDMGSLFILLKTAGFKTVRPWSPNKENIIDDQSKAHYPHRPENIKTGKFDKDQVSISLNLEAIK